jgi:hypothetical protein
VAAVELDRLKGAMRALARGAFPESLYSRVWRAKMVLQKSSLRVDVKPYDARLPPMANIPLKVGLPGAEVKIAPGHDVAVGWEDGRPDRPYATQWTPGTAGTKPLETVIHADLLELGGSDVTEALPMFETYRSFELKMTALLYAFAQSVNLAFAGTGPTPAPLKAAVAALTAELSTAITEFNNQTFYSNVVRNA